MEGGAKHESNARGFETRGGCTKLSVECGGVKKSVGQHILLDVQGAVLALVDRQ